MAINHGLMMGDNCYSWLIMRLDRLPTGSQLYGNLNPEKWR